jgi:hypothetical protein
LTNSVANDPKRTRAVTSNAAEMFRIACPPPHPAN